ncbi:MULTISPECIES: histone-like nucleoid-structuring protein, MvaT/MvaU family [Cobetia]|uniref:histone-like nucleoid-structuring protein, MvaT/MvaU family n=1 Tax=Cobetia TaxID=204286 RepID=UPI00178D06AA|nr:MULTISPECIES: histone-like nucleoid-structuring protein, MvaT/MvaU family [Cobetia]MBE2167462.1 H-NS histone [Cobetia sp. 2AS1]MDH2421725.1 H-NS histone [Cobetia litoralis]MDH2447093.1 H-NS histone [Cobetia sp. 2AS]
MSAVLKRFIEAEARLKQAQLDYEKMQSDPKFQRAMEVKEKLHALQEEYQMSADEMVALIKPEAVDESAPKASSTRQKRRMKKYVNPHTNEVIETRGGNHKGLKEWKKEYGEEEVESWGGFIE